MELSLFPRMRGWFMMNSIVLRSDMLIPSSRLTLGLTEPPRLQWRLICPVSFQVTLPAPKRHLQSIKGRVGTQTPLGLPLWNQTGVGVGDEGYVVQACLGPDIRPSNQPLRHIPKAPATLGKLGEGPFRHYLSLLQQYNPVTVPYRAQAVGDDDYCLLWAEILDGLHDRPLRDGVQGAGCLIKDQYGRVVVEGARAIPMRCLCPPDRRTPRSPTKVSYPRGSSSMMNSCTCAICPHL